MEIEYTGSYTGYTCDKCGSLVPSGTYHGCTVQYYPPMSNNDEEMKMLLKRVIQLLEKLTNDRHP